MMPVWMWLLLVAGVAICIRVLVVRRREDSDVDEQSKDIKDFKAKYAERAKGERTMKLDTGDKIINGCAVLAVLFHIAFWAAVAYVAVHFITKWW